MMSFTVTSNLIIKASQVNVSITQGSTIAQPNNSRQAGVSDVVKMSGNLRNYLTILLNCLSEQLGQAIKQSTS